MIKQRALLYVFGKRFGNSIVDVTQTELGYVVRWEPRKDIQPGRYDTVDFLYSDEALAKEIDDALKVLEWIAEGNEFPDST